MLVGMLQNSSYYDPFRRPEITRNRRNLVFNQMEKNEFISTKVKDSLKQLPLELEYNPQSHRRGLATYFRSYLRGFMKDWTSENLKKDGSKYKVSLSSIFTPESSSLLGGFTFVQTLM